MTSRQSPIATFAGVLVAVLATAVAARIDLTVPGSPVPQSLQTLAVVLIGAWFGPRVGSLAMLSYIGLGALGLPVFAGGEAGVATILGPTGGYLVGFVLGAMVSGILSQSSQANARWQRVLLGALAAHVVILACGWLWLTRFSDAIVAWQLGVSPFLWGGIIKSCIATAIVLLLNAAVPARD